MPAAVTCADLTFCWPDGEPAVDRIDLSIGAGRVGLIGANGSGKSTLLRLIAGELTPTRGSVRVSGSLRHLPQNLMLDAAARVDEVLGVAPIRAALRAVEHGHPTEDDFTLIGDDWDVAERARASLDRLGLGHIGLDRRVGELSGGECVLLGVASRLLSRPGVLLLDEPTAHLDVGARARVHDAVASFRGVLLVVSHDRDLLRQVDQIAELSDGQIRLRGGDIDVWQREAAAERETAERMVRAAGEDLRRQRRELAEAQVKLARRARYGKKMYAAKREPKVVMGLRKQQAQQSAGKHRGLHEDRVEKAQERLAEAEAAVRDDDVLQVDLPATATPAGRAVLVLDAMRPQHGPTVTLRARGPERIALVGPNGVGKTTLLRTIAGQLDPVEGVARALVPTRYLPQRLDLLDERLSVVENVAVVAPGVPEGVIRARLARFLFRGWRADQAVATLSGGERLRATLAALLLAEPAPQLLLLDEPTNSLDLASVARLANALRCYQGALVVASHDLEFLREIGVTRWLRLTREGLVDE